METSLFDVQVNGFAGIDFQQSSLTIEDVRIAAEGLARHQTERFFVTLITDSIDALCGKLEHFERWRESDALLASAICGYHIEGPWLSPQPGYRGAHDAGHMGAPDIESYVRLQAAANSHIRLITLAPELPGSAEAIRHIVSSGTEVSLGHTSANDREIDAAIAAGARFCTHLGNGVPAEMHRHDNVFFRLLARDELIAFFIPDGIHLPPSVLQTAYRAKPEGRRLFTTDAMAAAGAPAGRYRLSQVEVEVAEDGIVRVPGHPYFAGSSLTPDQGVENVGRWLGLSPLEARAAWSTAAAREFSITLPPLMRN